VRVVGVDVDTDALDNARENVDLNHLSDAVQLCEKDFTSEGEGLGRFDVVIANLTGGLLSRSAAELAAIAKPAAQLIVSGIQVHEFREVTGALEQCDWKLQCDLNEQDWVGALFRRI
jgi:ribosomal protein L11 methylase PrmA